MTGPAPIRVLATDLDRTFTRLDLKLDGDAVDAARRLRRAGVRTVLVTGRNAAELPEPTRLSAAFDAFVVEEGARCGPLHALQPTTRAAAVLGRLRAAERALAAAGVATRRTTYLLSVARSDEAVALRLPEVQACHVIPNLDRLDIAPLGIDKGVGLRRMLATWHVPMAAVAAIGDGENDVAMLRVARWRFAVANAVPAVKAIAHRVAPQPAAAGFVWAAGQVALANRSPVQVQPSRSVASEAAPKSKI